MSNIDDNRVLPVFIPFRLREGGDQRRLRNLSNVLLWWTANGFIPNVVSDGGQGDEQFNRHRAYNMAVEDNPEVDTFIFSEADMFITRDQILKAVDKAEEQTGLVVPFTRYLYTSDRTAEFINRAILMMEGDESVEWLRLPPSDDRSVFHLRFESEMSNGKSIGAVNVVSRDTLNATGGFTEATSGNWYDDNIIEEGFAFLTRRTRFVSGPAVHLYHLPGWKGDHLTEADKEATAKNKRILASVRRMIRADDRWGVKRVLSTRGERRVTDE